MLHWPSVPTCLLRYPSFSSFHHFIIKRHCSSSIPFLLFSYHHHHHHHHHHYNPSHYAFDMCSKLLDRNPATRLGTVSFEDIASHPWFEGIDWEKLYAKQVIPPFKPSVQGAEDVSNVDREFLQEVPAVTPTFEGKVLTDPAAFEGFSYNPTTVTTSG